MKKLLILVLSLFSLSGICQIQIPPGTAVSRNPVNDAIQGTIIATGSANTYAGTMDGATYVTNKGFNVTFNTPNTTVSTFSLNGGPAKTIKKWVANVITDVSANDLKGSMMLRYNGTYLIIDGIGNTGGGGGGTTFVSLTDGPGAYTGKGLNFFRVNTGETALEYQTPSQVKTDIGLGNVDNTTDLNKPVSTAQAAADALNLKIASNLSDLTSTSAARTNLGLVIGTDIEAHDTDLTTIAGLTPSNDDFLQRKSGAWTNRTIAQIKTDLGITSLVGGSSGDVQFNNAGVPGGSANFHWDNTNKIVNISNAQFYSPGNNLYMGQNAGNLSPDLINGHNISIGDSAQWQATSTAVDNISIGFRNSLANANTRFNVAIGNHALEYNTGGEDNTVIGHKADWHETNGGHNTAIGVRAMDQNNQGNNNVAIGVLALGNIVNGFSNIAIGNNCMDLGSNMSLNTVIGQNAGRSISGRFNAILGHSAGSLITGGERNVIVGYNCLGVNVNGEQNTALGFQAGFTSTGSRNVFIGHFAGGTETGNDKLYIANDQTTTPLIFGNFANKELKINGSLAGSFVLKTANYTITVGDFIVKCTGTFTLTLPTAVGKDGKFFIIKNSGAGTITLATTSSETIDGSAPGTLAAGSSLLLFSDGAGYISF